MAAAAVTAALAAAPVMATATAKANQGDSAHAEHVSPAEEVRQPEDTRRLWPRDKEEQAMAERINPDTGVFEVQDGFFAEIFDIWTPK